MKSPAQLAFEDARKGCEDMFPKSWDDLLPVQQNWWARIAQLIEERMREAELKAEKAEIRAKAFEEALNESDRLLGKAIRLNPGVLPAEG